MTKTLKPGEKTPRSGVYEIRGPRGEIAGKALSSTKSKPLPPTPKPEHGIKILESKSGRYIIASPAKSANTVGSWSDAFKKTN
jgi:hypothetical protein